jgi:hypothetical protein
MSHLQVGLNSLNFKYSGTLMNFKDTVSNGLENVSFFNKSGGMSAGESSEGNLLASSSFGIAAESATSGAKTCSDLMDTINGQFTETKSFVELMSDLNQVVLESEEQNAKYDINKHQKAEKQEPKVKQEVKQDPQLQQQQQDKQQSIAMEPDNNKHHPVAQANSTSGGIKTIGGEAGKQVEKKEKINPFTDKAAEEKKSGGINEEKYERLAARRAALMERRQQHRERWEKKHGISGEDRDGNRRANRHGNREENKHARNADAQSQGRAGENANAQQQRTEKKVEKKVVKKQVKKSSSKKGKKGEKGGSKTETKTETKTVVKQETKPVQKSTSKPKSTITDAAKKVGDNISKSKAKPSDKLNKNIDKTAAKDLFKADPKLNEELKNLDKQLKSPKPDKSNNQNNQNNQQPQFKSKTETVGGKAPQKVQTAGQKTAAPVAQQGGGSKVVSTPGATKVQNAQKIVTKVADNRAQLESEINAARSLNADVMNQLSEFYSNAVKNFKQMKLFSEVQEMITHNKYIELMGKLATGQDPNDPKVKKEMDKNPLFVQNMNMPALFSYSS